MPRSHMTWGLAWTLLLKRLSLSSLWIKWEIEKRLVLVELSLRCAAMLGTILHLTNLSLHIFWPPLSSRSSIPASPWGRSPLSWVSLLSRLSSRKVIPPRPAIYRPIASDPILKLYAGILNKRRSGFYWGTQLQIACSDCFPSTPFDFAPHICLANHNWTGKVQAQNTVLLFPWA